MMINLINLRVKIWYIDHCILLQRAISRGLSGDWKHSAVVIELHWIAFAWWAIMHWTTIAWWLLLDLDELPHAISKALFFILFLERYISVLSNSILVIGSHDFINAQQLGWGLVIKELSLIIFYDSSHKALFQK
jgi:hypothetical protein